MGPENNTQERYYFANTSINYTHESKKLNLVIFLNLHLV